MDPHPSQTDSHVLPILDYLENHMPGYPFEPEIDAPFVHELVEDFPALDVLEEIKTLRWYADNQPLKSATKPRIALRRWLARAKRRVSRFRSA